MIATSPTMIVVCVSGFRCCGLILRDMMLRMRMMLHVTHCASCADVVNAPSITCGVTRNVDAPMIAPMRLVMIMALFQRKIGKIMAMIQSQMRKRVIFASIKDISGYSRRKCKDNKDYIDYSIFCHERGRCEMIGVLTSYTIMS